VPSIQGTILQGIFRTGMPGHGPTEYHFPPLPRNRG
jgi:hypothetical protein